MCLTKSFPRKDYRELVNLILLYLGEIDSQESYTFKSLGAMHKAQWMAKLLYALKVDMLHKQTTDKLPEGCIYSQGQMEKLKRFANFCVFVYAPWWLTAPLITNAPRNDFLF